MRNRVRKAFTLVEILIVVVILGILAAIVIPQFTNASQDAQRGNVVTQLQSIRNQIELFRVRNNGNSPDLTTGSDFNQLITPPTGQQQYVRVAPRNPRVTGANATKVTTGTYADMAAINAAAIAIDPTGASSGWLYDPASGLFAAVGFDETTNKWFGEP